MSRNPDNPEKCSYLTQGIYCMEKSITHSYDDEVVEGKESMWVKCPFIRIEEMAKKCGEY